MNSYGGTWSSLADTTQLLMGSLLTSGIPPFSPSGIQVGSTYMLVNLTVIQIGSSTASQMAASAAAAATGDYDFFFGPFSSVRVLPKSLIRLDSSNSN